MPWLFQTVLHSLRARINVDIMWSSTYNQSFVLFIEWKGNIVHSHYESPCCGRLNMLVRKFDSEVIQTGCAFRRQLPGPQDFHEVGKDHAQHAKFDLDFRKRTNHVWLLDFNECKSFDTSTDGWIDQLVKAFYFNDPCYPRPVSTDPRDQELWQEFRTTYLDVSSKMNASELPIQFVEAVEKEGESRKNKLALQGGESLFKDLMG